MLTSLHSIFTFGPRASLLLSPAAETPCRAVDIALGDLDNFLITQLPYC